MKSKLIGWLASGMLMFNSAIFGAEAVSHLMAGDAVLVNVEEAGKQFGWEPKLEGDILVLCRDQLCVPLDLESVTHRKNGDDWFVDADTLGKVMGFTARVTDQELRLTALEASSNTAEDATYHSSWPEGRGFEPGETLPDIPLIDLEGNEVRFGDFLGKRYVIYGWASW